MVEESTNPESEEPRPRRVLVVEDDEGLNSLAQKALREAGYDTEGVSNGAEAIEHVMADRDLVILLDNRLPDMTGTELISALIERDYPVPPFVVMTGHGDETVAVEMMKLGASDYLVKELGVVERLPGAFRHLFRALDSERRLRAAEEALEERDARLLKAQEVARVGFLDWNLTSNEIELSEHVVEMFGLDPAKRWLSSELVAAVTYPEDREYVRENLEMAIRGEQTYDIDHRIARPDGEVLWVNARAEVERNELGDAVRLLGTVQDITERKRVEEALMRQQGIIALNNRIANVFLTSPSAEIHADVLDVLLETLDSRFGFFGYIDDAGDLVCPSMTRHVWDQCQIADKSNVFLRADWGGLWGRSLQEKRTLMANEGLRLPDGHVPLENALAVPIVHRDTLIGQFTLASKPGGFDEPDRVLLESAAAQTAPVLNALLEEDRQRRKHERLQQQYRQAQKMEAVGQLAGGVAHDFNNMLQVILGNGEMALFQTEADSPVHASVEEMMKAAARAATLISQLLAFSRQQILHLKNIDLNEVIADMAKLIGRVIGEDITIDVLPGHNLGVVRADPGQVQQILMNLCVNARDAMPEGGRITIEAENVRIDEAYRASHSWAILGRYALVSVTDTGCGMDEDTLSHVFEPFFTTKGPGEGTGLGLSMVYGLVKQHEGMVQVYSEVGKGTSFKIYLPVTERSAATVGDKIEGPAIGGTETILVAEDEPMVLRLTKDILEQAGYTVLTAGDGEEALRVFDEHADAIDLVLLDVVMPHFGGRAVFEQIREKRPQVRVLFTSGYSTNVVHTNFVLDEGLTLLQKPHEQGGLMRKVREVLDQE